MHPRFLLWQHHDLCGSGHAYINKRLVMQLYGSEVIIAFGNTGNAVFGAKDAAHGAMNAHTAGEGGHM